MTPEQAERLLPALVYVQTHLDEELSLEILAASCRLSPHHFHRLFRAAVGETARRYVERLRLERAAFVLSTSEATILDAGLATGFQSHEVFSRAFKRRFGVAPSAYRRDTPYLGRAAHPSEQTREPPFGLSRVRVRSLGPMHLAFVRHVGPYEDVPPALFAEVRAWLAARGVRGGTLAGIGHDAPGITAPEQLRFDACVVVPESFEGDGRVAYQRFDARTVAAITFVGPLRDLPRAYERIGTAVRELKGYRLVGLPVVEMYSVTAITAEDELLQVDIMLPVERLVG